MCLVNRKAGRLKHTAWRITEAVSLYLCWLSGETLLLGLLLFVTSKFHLYHQWLIRNKLTTYKHMQLLKPAPDQKLATPTTNQVLHAAQKTSRHDTKPVQNSLLQHLDVRKLATEPKQLSVPSKPQSTPEDDGENQQTRNHRDKSQNRSGFLEKIAEQSVHDSSAGSGRRAASSKDIKVSIQSKSFPLSQQSPKQPIAADGKQPNSASASSSLNDSSNRRLVSEKAPPGSKVKKIIALETKNSPLRKSLTQRDKSSLEFQRQGFFE